MNGANVSLEKKTIGFNFKVALKSVTGVSNGGCLMAKMDTLPPTLHSTAAEYFHQSTHHTQQNKPLLKTSSGHKH